MPRSLDKLGLHTLGDMLYYYPRRYDDYSQLKPIKNLFYGEQVTVIGTIQTVHTRPIRGGKASIIEIIISDGTGGLRLSFFNQPWMANRYQTRRCHLGLRQDRPVPRPPVDEQSRCGIGRYREPATRTASCRFIP